MNNRLLGVVLVVTAFVLLLAEPAFAGPGGYVARALFESFWGRLLLGVLTIVLLPIILWVVMKEKLAERRTLADLRYMARLTPTFDWLKVRQRAIDCFCRVHAAWRKEDTSEASQWMTDWYWQNQQMAHLDRWEREGLRNVCNLGKITRIRPLLFSHCNDDAEHEGSMLVIAIEAVMQDYLERRSNGEVVEGSKKSKEVETLWTFTLTEGRWLVSNIEEGSMSLAYANLSRQQDPIQSTLLTKTVG
jgi:hypothetical protein